MSGKIELILGPMFSGKSTKLIRKIRLYKNTNKKVLVVKPLIDTRYVVNQIASHSFETENCETTELLTNIDNKVKNYDIIIIDEGQFFSDLKIMVLKWADEYKKEVIIAGLDGDSNRNPIGHILELIPLANKFKKMSSICKYCNDGTPAPFTHRLCNSIQQVEIGGAESYIPLCRKHYLEMNK